MSIAEDLIIGSSKSIHSIRESVSKIANTDVTVLISGEPGTGKTLLALAIHQMSQRADESLLQFDCAATSERYLELELFGSGEAGKKKKGLLASANGRTVLFDNIDHTPLKLQAKLLRVFQERKFENPGETEVLETDCRFIGTSRRDMIEKVEARLFREDFYYRLNVVHIKVPALRERTEDIEPLIYEIVERLGKNAKAFMTALADQGLLEYLEKYSWPGNVRELQQVIETLVLTEAWDSVRQILLGHGNGSSRMLIERCIEFPPEYHQAGVSILSFFGEILRRAYPDHEATVRIEQDGLRVKMTVEPLLGKVEVFERALDEYGLVLTGQITPEQFTTDPFLAMNLKHELRLAQARIESQRELLHYQEKHMVNREHQVEQMMNFIGRALQAPQPHHFNISVSPHINCSVEVEAAVTVSTVIKDICSDLNEVSNIVRASGEEPSIVDEVTQDLKRLQENPVSGTESATSIGKLKRLIERLADAEDRIGKTIRATKKGMAVAQRLAKRYNEIAQWFGWPQVPKPFLGSDTST